ncbi:MAG: TonB-dependent receptor, partial [Novosphingobium sp.]
ITRKPGNEFAANLSASYGNYAAVRFDAGVDVPLGDAGAIRFSGFYDERDGYVKHPARNAFGPFPAFAGGASDDNQNYGGRVSLRFEPTDALTINLSGEYAEKHFTPSVFAYADLNAAGNAPAGPGCNMAGYTRVAPNYAETLCVPNGTNFLSTIDRGNFAAPGFGLGKLDDKTYAIRGRVAYEISDAATLTYIGGYRSFEETGVRTLPVSYRSYTFLSETKTQSHELRLNGVVGGITYQVGGFYFKEAVDVESGFLIPVGPNGTFLSYFGRDITSDSKSLFGQVEVPVGDKITLVGGLRYTDNGRDAIYLNRSFIFNSGPSRQNFTGVTPLVLSVDESKVTWLAGINFQPSPDTLIYAKASTGFKGGGFDSVGDYKPETNTAYEAGWKQSFGPRSEHQINLGAFYYDYKDLQVSVLLDTAVGGQTFNAGAATIWGIEASADFKVSPTTTFRASFNYLSAKYDELFAQFNVFRVPGTGAGDRNGIGDLDPTVAGVQQPNFAGNRPAFSPEVVATIGFDQVIPLGDAGSLTFSANSMMKSSYFTDFYNYQDGRQSGYHQTDVSLTWKSGNEKFSLQVFAKNLEDVRPLTYGSFVSAGPDDIFNWQFGTPRTYGLRLTLDY